MKLSKGLFLAFAGLGLFACSNEDVTENGAPIDGDAMVTVKINLPRVLEQGRSGNGVTPTGETTATTGGTTPLTVNSITVTLHAAAGEKLVQSYTASGGSNDFTFSNSNGSNSNGKTGTITFTGVRNPQSIEVSVNGGTATALTLAQINAAALAAPLHKVVNVGATDDGNKFTWNSEEKKYIAEVTPEPRYARLEISEISHAAPAAGESCIFSAATIAGVFLDNLITTEGENVSVNVSGDKTIWNNIGQPTYASPTWSTIGSDFLASGAKWPATPGTCYAYSLFGDQLPKLVFVIDGNGLAFTNSTVPMPDYTSGSDIYATVSNYKINKPTDWDTRKNEYMSKYGVNESGYFTSFKDGCIYKISDIAIPDKAWGTTPAGGSDVTVEAIVKVLAWNVVEGTVEWN
ncbi:hypothetical protein [Bacteroides mediterraneensis]|uniref:hypothetical protein n=1 Tax=Bacteroides mediterraneensis TaxID=1841856 RepID=UPI0026E93D2D|nr:hypothetical protein [Bacteroides mediterraneensis]